MINRDLKIEALQAAKEYPVVTIIGPRQSGKTTLAKSVFKGYEYCSLESPDIRQAAKEDPRGFLNRYNNKVILDEIQRAPELLSYIQTLVDEHNTPGRFVLTGSHQLELRSEVNQSLAGRTALLTLLPLTISELKKAKITLKRDDHLYRGFFPKIHNENINPSRAHANYYKTYVERDVRQLINLKNVTVFENFLKLLAGRAGQLINLSSMSNDVGASSTTLKEWLSILEASFIIFKLPPYFENFGKRTVKASKYYFTDVGLLCYLLGIEKKEQVSRDPLIGNIFENMIVLEFLKHQYNAGRMSNLYFYRDSNGNEVDLIWGKGRDLVPIEIKSSATFNSKFAKAIINFQSLSSKATKGLVVYSGDFYPKNDSYDVMSYSEIHKYYNSSLTP